MSGLLRFAVDEDVFALVFWSLVAVLAVVFLVLAWRLAEAVAVRVGLLRCRLTDRRAVRHARQILAVDGAVEQWAYDEWLVFKQHEDWPAGDVMDVAREVFDVPAEVSQEIPRDGAA